MLRAVVDVNVFVSAVLTPGGSPHRLLRAWLEGAFELVLSPALVTELERVLARPEIVEKSDPRVLHALVAGFREEAIWLDDPSPPARVVDRDPADDYLVALALDAGAYAIVTGDRHMLELDDLVPPALTPAAFLEVVARLG